MWHLPFLRLFQKIVSRLLLRDPRQWLVFGLLCAFFAMSGVFYHLGQSYRQLFLDSLQGIYPELFCQTNGTPLISDDAGTIHEEEVFQLATNLHFRLKQKGEEHVLPHLGIRAVSAQKLRRLVSDQSTKSKQAIWVNRELAEALQSDGKPVTQLFLLGAQEEWLPVAIHKIELHTDRPWMLLSMELVAKLALTTNITAIESQLPLPILREQYKQKGLKLIHWTERLPFGHMITYRLSIMLSLWVSAGLLILVLGLVVSFFRDLLGEFANLVRIARLYGVSLTPMVLIFNIFTLAYLLCLYASATLLQGSVLKLLALYSTTMAELCDAPISMDWQPFLATLACVLLANLITLLTAYRGFQRLGEA